MARLMHLTDGGDTYPAETITERDMERAKRITDGNWWYEACSGATCELCAAAQNKWMKTALYLTRIDGYAIVAGCVIRTMHGARIRLHARRSFGKLYWTADCGEHWAPTKNAAYYLADGGLDVLPPR